jgi:methyl-accepting chemotaxis protein
MQGKRGGSEVRKVLTVWIVLFLVISAVSVAVLVYSSISLLNGKTNALKEDVAEQTGDYYRNALDTTLDFVNTHPGVLVGKELWDTDPNTQLDLPVTLEFMRELLRTSFNAEYVVYAVNKNGSWVVEATPKGVDLAGLPQTYTEGFRIIHGLKRDGDTFIGLGKNTDYPFTGQDGLTTDKQYIYSLVDITEQTDAITALYQDSRSQLLWSQLIISLILLLLSLILAPLGIAWAVRKYVAAPILEMDDLSKQIIEGTLQGEVEVDEASSFADIQRLLRGAQELLRNI